jgi:heat shock protein HtpX
MAMNFWEAQRHAKAKTFYYLVMFFMLTCIAAVLCEWALRTFAAEQYQNPPLPYVAIVFFALTLLTAGFNYLRYVSIGGRVVAETVGAVEVDPMTTDFKERQLLNIVQEIALATSLPVPPVFIIKAKEINAFAAGTSPDNAAIAVTRGCLNLLNRDELQGVLAHEFGHIYNKDMTIGMRVAAMIMGFFIVMYVGLKMLQWTSYSRSDDNKKGVNPLLVAAVAFLIIGAVTWFFGTILQAMVSRQREYLADACSVQFTRNPEGLANALRKIADSNIHDMPATGKPFAHLYFNERSSFWNKLFATHPPVEDRINRIMQGYNENENV